MKKKALALLVALSVLLLSSCGAVKNIFNKSIMNEDNKKVPGDLNKILNKIEKELNNIDETDDSEAAEGKSDTNVTLPSEQEETEVEDETHQPPGNSPFSDQIPKKFYNGSSGSTEEPSDVERIIMEEAMENAQKYPATPDLKMADDSGGMNYYFVGKLVSQKNLFGMIFYTLENDAGMKVQVVIDDKKLDLKKGTPIRVWGIMSYETESDSKTVTYTIVATAIEVDGKAYRALDLDS